MSRRKFSTLAIALIGAAGPVGLDPAAAAGSPAGGAFGRIETVRAIGRAYLRRFPQELPASRLAELALERGAEPTAWRDRAAVRRALSRRPAELAVGDVVIVAGWVLARTEARLCALAALG